MDENKDTLPDTLSVEREPSPDIKLDEPQLTPVFGKKNKFIKKGPLTKKEKIYFTIAVVFILAVGVGLLVLISNQKLTEVDDIKVANKVKVKYYSPLNGVEVADESATKRTVTAVMIENSPDARPQSGLAEADVVFEAVAEGGITRFIALYQNSQPGLIGPVRSLRPYYVDWASGFDPSVAHVGGSPDALNMIRSGNYGVDIDQFFNSGSYWRSNDRSAPHNVYTNFEKLNALNASKDKTSSNFKFAPRTNEKRVEPATATSIHVEVSSGLFTVDYSYDTESNSYIRKQGGVEHTDREKGQIKPKVVVALKTDISLSSDGSHMNIATNASGTAYVFQNGGITEGVWSKAGPKDQLFIKNADGSKEIPLIRGQTWVTVIANDKTVSWQ